MTKKRVSSEHDVRRGSKEAVKALPTKANTGSYYRNPLKLVASLPKSIANQSKRGLTGLGEILRKVVIRKPLYGAWAKMFKCNMDEIPEPLEYYPSLAQFFSRPIKEGARPIAQEGMVSPVDGRVLACGEVTGDMVEQVKGVNYSLSHFLGCDPYTLLQNKDKGTKLYQCILYLSPGDYHRIHSSEDWCITKRSHFPGTLFPVNKPFLKLIPSLFALNERVVLMGNWLKGFYSLTAVGAYNVGSISLSFGDQIQSNRILRDFRCKNLEYFSWNGVGSHSYDREYEQEIPQTRGQEIGQFHLGSTVVLIFEAKNFEFTVKQGDYCKMGSVIGNDSGSL
eukprot:gene13831-16308_t